MGVRQKLHCSHILSYPFFAAFLNHFSAPLLALLGCFLFARAATRVLQHCIVIITAPEAGVHFFCRKDMKSVVRLAELDEGPQVMSTVDAFSPTSRRFKCPFSLSCLEEIYEEEVLSHLVDDHKLQVFIIAPGSPIETSMQADITAHSSRAGKMKTKGRGSFSLLFGQTEREIDTHSRRQ